MLPSNMATVRIFEVMSRNIFNVTGMYTRGNYAQKLTTKLYNYEFIVADNLTIYVH